MSYGFGANGGGGVVLYTGFLDEVMQLNSVQSPPESPISPPRTQATSIWSTLLGGLNTRDSRSPNSSPHDSSNSQTPTREQTAALATLLAHEMSHLILAHHLETLSSGTILVPTVTGIFSDFLRVILFPLSFIGGPFVSDAIADAGKVGIGEMSKHGEACTSRKLELEADLVSVRLMSLAGFDPKSALSFWEGRLDDNGALDADLLGDCAYNKGPEGMAGSYWSPHSGSVTGSSAGPSHPLGAERVRRLRDELGRWEMEREKVRKTGMTDGASGHPTRPA